MSPEVPYQYEVTFLAIRIIAGLLFFLQGYDKLFVIGIQGVYETFHEPMHKKNVPDWVLRVSAWFTTWVELLGGLLLLMGLFTPWVAMLLLLDLLLVILAFGILEPMWDMKHVFPRLVLLVGILLIPHSLNLFSIDYFLFK
ncbi:MAG: DoxX family membrane protein [Flavobacteriales bacterium]